MNQPRVSVKKSAFAAPISVPATPFNAGMLGVENDLVFKVEGEICLTCDGE